MGYSDSICFSATPAEALNKKSFQLNRSLFLFAYYEPKPYIENESSKYKFQTAIINLYGLFWDCGPFVFSLLYTPDSILINDRERIYQKAYSLRDGISGFRSVFCHNCSDQYPLNTEKLDNAFFWASLYSKCSNEWKGIDDISEAEWEKLLAGLVTEADCLINDLDISLDKLNTTPDINRRQRAIDRWITQIAITYRENPEYLLNTLVGLYQLYLLNSNSYQIPGKDLRHLTIDWLCNNFNISINQKKQWHAKWLEPMEHVVVNTSLYAILKDWPNRWAIWNGSSADECDEAPMPASVFFRILANDVDQFAQQPWTRNVDT